MYPCILALEIATLCSYGPQYPGFTHGCFVSEELAIDIVDAWYFERGSSSNSLGESADLFGCAGAYREPGVDQGS